ncbi:glycosyltransferase family 4 protein [Clostridium sp. SYSU_GA19001]|uniref:glycosyltransferase family 4 protein n=1 Tax=Clostridium caldaquaticum TaxID=2940653 RepID=UPI0020777FD3|nr:glycosyltransferase family 1 protein [Clostridium caldaquaticum]MCM8709412.1 glycosyltransferase family 4 protein [Clostridium caldaquaticum]
MNIGIDARPLSKYKTGIGFYLDSLLTNLLEIDKENVYYLFSDRHVVFEGDKYKNLIVIEDSNKIYKKTLWYLFKVPQLIRKYNIDIFWGTQHVLPLKLYNAKSLLTIHDLVVYEMPETMQTYNKLINKIFIPFSIKKADKIIAVSKATKLGIHKYFYNDIDTEKISVIYEDGTYIEISKEQEVDFFKKNNKIVPKEYLLYVGTIEPRKNISTLLKAYESIRKETDLKLVLCGKLGWKSKNIKEAIHNHKYAEDIIYLNYVTNVEKHVLMKNCFIFIFPSLYEGFGLPVVEAMKQNAVTIVSNSSSLKELVELEELKFEKFDYEKLSNKIENLYNNEKEYERLKAYCIRRGKEFNWQSVAKDYLNIIRNMKN